MDLDFSFTLVSSLTPRSKVVGTPRTENKYSTKSLTSKKKKLVNNFSDEWQKSEKENYLPEERLMNKTESSVSPHHSTHNYAIRSRNKKSDTDETINIDLVNVAIRKNRFRDRRKSSGVQNVSDHMSFKKSSSEVSPKSHYKHNIGRQNACTQLANSCSIINVLTKKGTKRKSPDLYEMVNLCSGDDTVDLIEDSISDSKNVPAHKKVSLSPSISHKVSLQKSNSSGITDQFVSPAYSSDFSIGTRKKGTKIIPETPETDDSLTNDRSLKEHMLLNDSLTKNKQRAITRKKNDTELLKAKSSFSKSAIETKEQDLVCPAKKIGSELAEPFVNEQVVKNNKPICRRQKNKDTMKKGQHKSETSPVLKELNGKELNGFKDITPDNSDIIIIDDSPNLKLKNKSDTNVHNKVSKKKRKSKEKEDKKCLITDKPTSISPNPSLIPPSEVISKFEHITNWLRSTEKISVTPVSGEDSLDSPKYNVMPPKQVSKLIGSLSPRIKRKMKVAKSSLEEEQKLFDELYGDGRVKRLSDDREDGSVASFQEPLELSEKVLDKLYGTVWQKNTVLPQSEPKKKSKQKIKGRHEPPQTERRKKRTSIYDVFSSSSSEDRFEEFLENVRRGKAESKQQTHNPSPPEFINDSDSESNCSLVFYQNIVSSAVKDDVHKLTHELHNKNEKPPKVNRRRLSFTSCKDDYSESSKPENKSVSEIDKKKKDNRSHRTRTKKVVNTKSKVKASNDVNSFNLVTPIKISSSDSDNVNEKSEGKHDYNIPKSVGKSRTPKHNPKSTNNITPEREKFFEQDIFKMPTSLRTPVNSAKNNCPSSPALSFLSSLSEVNGGLPCHPDAKTYKKDFKIKKEELTKKLFNLYNKEVFDSKLPADMLIQWNTRMTSTSGYCYNKRIYRNNQVFRSSRIVLSTKILDRPDRLRDTLIHELCHAATWIVNETSDGHGPKWKAWADKANRRFPELPLIKRCHDYAISTKYTYKCMSCGYCIGRHSKSLNTDRKRCGFCYGVFQVFVTSKMATSSVTSGSDSVKTPRNPTGFALFVKENYAVVKKENNVPHAQVMKLLSQKFAEVKITKTALET